MNGDGRAALHVRHRLGQRQLTVHVLNALLVACQLGSRWHEAAALQEQIDVHRIPSNQVCAGVRGCLSSTAVMPEAVT